jgi:ADP-ribosylglycohydrolase
MVGGGSFGLKPGQWTDDTSMALCLAASLTECGRFFEGASNEQVRVDGRSHAIPEPGEDDGGSFAEAGRDIDELRVAGAG